MLPSNSFPWHPQIIVHTSNAYCIDFEPSGKYVATGGADGMVNIIDTDDLVCVRTLDRLEYVGRCTPCAHRFGCVARCCVARASRIPMHSTCALLSCPL